MGGGAHAAVALSCRVRVLNDIAASTSAYLCYRVIFVSLSSPSVAVLMADGGNTVLFACLFVFLKRVGFLV